MTLELEELVKKGFGVDLNTFTEAIRFSPGAQGYINGSISEFILRKLLGSKGYETERIIEKWKGKKLLRHHGDFYIRKKGHKKWYVLELKGLKSNSEEWHKLNDQNRLIVFLKKWNESAKIFASEEEIEQWCQENFESKISKIKIRLIETHFVAGRRKKNGRKIATNRNDEFDYVAVDLFLRTGLHEFIFARPKDLPTAEGYPEHLRQNYVIDVLLAGKKEKVTIQPPWYRDLDEIFDETKEPIREEDMQINERAKTPGLATGPWLFS